MQGMQGMQGMAPHPGQGPVGGGGCWPPGPMAMRPPIFFPGKGAFNPAFMGKPGMPGGLGEMNRAVWPGGPPMMPGMEGKGMMPGMFPGRPGMMPGMFPGRPG